MDPSPDIVVVEIVPVSQVLRDETSLNLSWPFRLAGLSKSFVDSILGIISLIFLLAVISSVPILNLLAFGYLLEVTRRAAERQPLKKILVGNQKGRYIGGVLLGVWLMLIPIRYLSHIAYEAHLVDPEAATSSRLFLIRSILVFLLAAHVAAALICGGKLRYLFWPLVAPFSILLWLVRRMSGWKWFRASIKFLTEWISPNLADDFCRVKPINDWFLPAIFLKKISERRFGREVVRSALSFMKSLSLPYFFFLGLKGFVGTLVWLAIPTLLLAGATLNPEARISVPSALLGTILAIPVFCLLPILQTHFAVNRSLSSFCQLGRVITLFRRAPVWHLIAWIAVVLLSLPLFLLKIETVPQELLWMLSIVFWIFSLPARLVSGFAYGRSEKAAKVCRWWLTVPMGLLLAGVSGIFLLILTTTRYTSWNGALSLFENHVFLMPTPFWL